MNGQINQLVKSLLKKETLEQCSLQELEQFAERHPYFGAAQLLLTKKLKEENSDRYGEQLQKTFSFFNNPLWVQHLLNETGTAELIIPENSIPETEITVDVPEEVGTEPVEETIVVPANEETITVITEEDLTLELPAEPAPEISQEAIAEVKALIADEKPVKEELLFEPFHTVDYFASQGIQIREDPKPGDKFSHQLRSFTDWLKSMKRLPATEIGKTISAVSENNVVQLAQHSLAEKEIVTEAMAAVWEKQGNITKAIDIYKKLSLLEPAKSHNFAAKIEELKKKN